MTTATPKAAGVPATFGWRLPWVLGLGAFGLAFSITTTAAYLPPLLGRFTDSRTHDRGRARSGGHLRAHAPGRDRALERHVSHAARPPAAVHARRARADGLLPRADGVHAEPLDDDADRARVLLRVLRLRAALPRALSGPAASVGLRALPGHPARLARARARARARRRRLPLPRLAARAVPDRRVRDHARVRRGDRLRRGGRRPRPRLRGRPCLRRAQLAHHAREHRRTALAGGQCRLGGSVRCRADVRRPLHHARPAPAALDLVGGARHRRCRLHDRGGPLGAARRPGRARARDLRRPRSSTAVGCSSPASRARGRTGTTRSSSRSRSRAAR